MRSSIGTLDLAPTPIYITVALFATFSSIVSTYARNDDHKDEKWVRGVCDLLFVGLLICTIQVITYVFKSLLFSDLTTFDAVMVSFHLICYLLVILLVSIWHRVMITFTERKDE